MTPNTTVERVFNFSPGPAAVPLPVLEKAREEWLNYAGTGMSITEVTHRSKEFAGVLAQAKQRTTDLLKVPQDYEILFLQGGARLQFAMVPMNLYRQGSPVDVIHTGTWTKQAIGELEKIAEYKIAASTEAENFKRLPSPQEIKLNPSASYVHLCSNNTIYGTQWKDYPETGQVPLVADMTSDIVSRKVDISKFGLIFASAQKNLGIAGVTMVIIRKDLLDRPQGPLPSMLDYRAHVKANSLLNTAPTFPIYMMNLVLEWLEAQGGVEGIEKQNQDKAKLLYDVIDKSSLYQCPVNKEDRSVMNVVFTLKQGGEKLEKEFIEQARTHRLVNLKGHRSVGGFRASIYNAQTQEGVKTLVDFMRAFETSA